MATISKFEDLIIWQLAEQQEKEIYELVVLVWSLKQFFACYP